MASPSAAAQDYSAVVFHRWYLCAVQSFQIGDFNRGEGRGRACQDAILPISHFQVCETDSVMVPILWAESGRAVSKSSRPERAGAALWQTSMIRQAAVKKDQLVKMTNVCQAGIGAHPEASVAGRCLQFRGLLQVTVGGGGGVVISSMSSTTCRRERVFRGRAFGLAADREMRRDNFSHPLDERLDAH